MKTIAETGEIMQLGFVPKNKDIALEFWTKTIGAGPFYIIDNVTFQNAYFRGVKADIEISAAIGYWGSLQIELIWQHGDAPSVYTEWRNAGGEGLHHICLVTSDIAAARENFERAGADIVQYGSVGEGLKFFYADTGGGAGTMTEVIQLSEEIAAAFDGIKAASIGWNGEDPIRHLAM